MSDNTPAAIAAVAAAHDSALVTMGFGNLQSFEFMQRTAKLFATSTMVPAPYQAVISKGYGQNQKWEQNPAALSNCMVALDLAQRMNASPLQVMQNLHVIEGRPSWSSSFIIALINNCGLYAHNLRFRIEWQGEIDAVYTTSEWVNNHKTEVQKIVRLKNAICVAWTKDKASGDIVESPPVTLEMAVQEGWYTRNGSKWRSMTQLMLQYRAAAFFGRANNPELLMGLPTEDEIRDIIDVKLQADGTYAAPAPTAEATAAAASTSVDAPKPRAPRAKSAATATDASDVKDVAPASVEETRAPVELEAQLVIEEISDEAKVEAAATAKAQENQERLAKLTANQKPAPEAETVQVAATGSATAPLAPTAVGKPLSDAKTKFVTDSMAKANLTAGDMLAKLGFTPDQITDVTFPTVLVWFKDPTK